VVLKPVVPVRPNEVVNVFTADRMPATIIASSPTTNTGELRENGGDVFVDVAALESPSRYRTRSRHAAQLRFSDFGELFPNDGGVQPFRGRFYNAEECKRMRTWLWVVQATVFGSARGGNDFVASTLHINGQPYHRHSHCAGTDSAPAERLVSRPISGVPLGHAFRNSVQLSAIPKRRMTC